MVGFATWEMRGELSYLWQTCFEEPRRPANYFFNNAFDPNNCLVYRVSGHIAAMLHLVPIQLVQPGRTSAQAHYVFACATLPQYRSHGFMNTLLAYAALIGTRRGDQYSLLLPASQDLYEYYQKSDYTSFFQIEKRELTRFQMEELAGNRKPRGVILTAEQLNGVRTQILAERGGSVLWQDRSVWFAVGSNAVYGGRLVCARANTAAYALCRWVQPEICEVTEWMAQPDAWPALAAQLLHDMPAKTFQLRLPRKELFPFGEISVNDFGMIKPLGGEGLSQFDEGMSYLGLAMD